MNKRLMVIGDSPEIQKVLREVMKAGLFEPVRVNDDEDAERAAIERKPDLTLFDVAMPGLDSREICCRLIDFYLGFSEKRAPFFPRRSNQAFPSLES